MSPILRDPGNPREVRATLRYYSDITKAAIRKGDAPRAANNASIAAHLGYKLLALEEKALTNGQRVERRRAEEAHEIYLKNQAEEQARELAFEAVQNRLTEEVPDNANTDIDLSPRDGEVLAGDVHGDPRDPATVALPVDTR